MKLKIAVCDDNKVDQDYVIDLLRKYADEKGIILEIHAFISAEQFLFQYADEKDYQIIVLDIEMEKMNGVELAKKLREDNREIQIFFITGYPDYISEGYEVEALHYLMKPVSGQKFFKVMDKAVANLKVAEKVLFIQGNGEMLKVLAKNIYYVEVFSHSCIIHTTEGDIETQMSISDLEKNFLEGFIRVHRSYLVNLEQVKKIARTEIFLENGSTVPLARRKYKDVNIAFIRHFGGRAGAE
uniref:LytR/AlgR family response regulator transcription factor n=1 Tax=Acetatifactor sp. TaxID=1872090 RepID=UPI004057BB45